MALQSAKNTVAPKMLSQSGVSTQSTMRTAATISIVLLIALGAWYAFTGDRVTLSKTGYELSIALYSACNLEDPRRLSLVKSKLEQEALSTGSLSPEEHSKVMSIVDLAQSGQWKDAAMQARRLIESQDSH